MALLYLHNSPLEEMVELTLAALHEARAERDKRYPVYNQYRQLKREQSALLTEQFKLESALEALLFEEKNEAAYQAITPEKHAAVAAKLAKVEEQLAMLKKNDKAMDTLRLQLKAEIKKQVATDMVAKKLSQDIRARKKSLNELYQLQACLAKNQETDASMAKFYKATDSQQFLLNTYSRLGFVPKATGHLYSATALPGPLNGIETSVGQALNYFSWLPPLRIALVGTLGLLDLYRLMQSKESGKLKISRGVLAVGAIGLGIAALVVPSAMAVIFAATVIGLGAIREGLNYYSASRQVSSVEQEIAGKKVQLAQLIKIQGHNEDAKISYTHRIAYLKRDIQQHETYLKQLQATRKERRDNLILSVLSVVSVILMIFPPTALLGAGIFLSTIAVSVNNKIGFVGKMWNKISPSKNKPEPSLPDVSETQKPAPEVTLQPTIKEARSEAAIFTKLDELQHPQQAKSEIIKHSAAVIKETIESLHNMKDTPSAPVVNAPPIVQSPPPPLSKEDSKDDDANSSHPTEHM